MSTGHVVEKLFSVWEADLGLIRPDETAGPAVGRL